MTTIRETFLPDDGCVMVRCDLSQIEDRICKMYCGTERMIELANRRPEVYDAHVETARAIFKRRDITKEERYLSKKVRHGSQRGLRGQRMSETISKDTDGKTFIHPGQCDKMIDKFLELEWEVRDIYFPWVRQRVMDDGVLVNSWGRRLDFRLTKEPMTTIRIDDDIYREAYSFYMQSECADWTNQYLFIPTYYYMMQRYKKPASAQVHDEVIICVPWKDSYEMAYFMLMAAEQTREIPANTGNYLCVPAEITVGKNWADNRFEFKTLPSKQEYEEITYALYRETVLGEG